MKTKDNDSKTGRAPNPILPTAAPYLFYACDLTVKKIGEVLDGLEFIKPCLDDDLKRWYETSGDLLGFMSGVLKMGLAKAHGGTYDPELSPSIPASGSDLIAAVPHLLYACDFAATALDSVLIGTELILEKLEDPRPLGPPCKLLQFTIDILKVALNKAEGVREAGPYYELNPKTTKGTEQ